MRTALIRSALALAILASAGAATAQHLPSYKTAPDILRYIDNHPQDTALVSYTAAPDGTPDPGDPVIFHNADEPMPLASVIKVVVLAAYAREVVAGRLDPNEEITLEAWERFYLPRTDGGAHSRSLAALGIPADENGFALEPATRVPLDALARAMIRWSDNAATDFLLLKRVSHAALRATILEAGLTGQEMPRPLVGLFLSWTNHEEGSLTRRRLQELLGLSPVEYLARVRRFASAYQNGPWREEERRWLLEGRYAYQYPLEVQIAGTFPAGTARDYARILAGVVTGTFLSPEISAVMRPHLERDLLGSTDFDSIGFKGGTLAGVINEAAWFVPREGRFAGKPRIVVLFLRDLPPIPWSLLVRDAGQVVFAFRVARDRSFAERTRDVLAPGG